MVNANGCRLNEKNGLVKSVDIRWHNMEDLNTYITATISFVSSIRHL